MKKLKIKHTQKSFNTRAQGKLRSRKMLLMVFILSTIIPGYAQVNEDAFIYANFENKRLTPQVGSHYLSVERGKIYVVENPDKTDANNSNYVMKVVTPESSSNDHARAEYRNSGTIPTKNKHHIYQWMVYFPENYLVNVQVGGTWQIIAQFATAPCAEYGEGEYSVFSDRICGTGGIFNEIRIDGDNRGKYGFEYRAAPDCNTLDYTYTKGVWTKITYDIYWTTGFDGYYNLYINNNLLGHAENVRTLPEGWEEGTCDIFWKVGLYDRWSSNSVDSVYYFLDNVELYIDKDIEDICAECKAGNTVGSSKVEMEKIDVFPNPANDYVSIYGLQHAVEINIYTVTGALTKKVEAKDGFYISDLSPGIYFMKFAADSNNYSKTIIKQ